MIEIDTEEDISMNKTQLKNFAVAARVALIERVKDRARGFGIDEKTCAGGAVIPSKMVQTLGGALLSQTEINQRDALLARIQSRGYDQVMEETAYTWFNRFIALRYMQEHNLLPVSVRVLPDAPGALPELVRQAQNVELDGVDFSHVVELLEGNGPEMEEWLSSGRIDIAFTSLQPHFSFDTIRIQDDPMMAVLPRTHPMAGAAVFPVGRFKGEPFLVYMTSSNVPDEDLARAMRIAGIPKKAKLSSNFDVTILSMVEHNLGVTIMPRLILEGLSLIHI